MRLLALCLCASAVVAPFTVCADARLGSAAVDPRPLRFGVTAAGQVFTSQPAPPDDPVRTMEALGALRASSPFVVRLNRFFSRDGEAGIAPFVSLARRYTDAGFLVSLQLRYGPSPPSPDAFASWVRSVVRAFGEDRGVVSLEVTNEPNLGSAPDNSDGAFAGVTDALAGGVLAARDEIDANGYAHLEVGFNWFHETGPSEEDAFWRALRVDGFADALDWVGLNAYPGTYDHLATPPGQEGREMVRALAVLRGCYMPLAGIGPDVGIRVMENGYPSGLAVRSALMAPALERMVRATAEHAGTFNVTDYLWFDLRDSQSGALPNERNYGLVTGDYVRKPAFESYRALVAELS